MGFLNFLKDAFSEGGVASSKRIMGAMLVLVFIICQLGLVFKSGATVEVVSLLNTSLYCAVGLLGLGCVADIFKNKE